MSSKVERRTSKSPGPSPRKRSPSTNGAGKRSKRAPKWEQALFSPNPDKAWAEKFYLAYSLVWPVLFASWAASGYHLHAGDSGNLLVTLLIAAPNVVYPYLYAPKVKGKRWYEQFWVKYMVWLFIFAFVATYFWTEYFFDVLGMKYAFGHLKWNFDSILLGTGRQRVPLMMLFHAWYFFIMYHTGSVVFIRFVRNGLAKYVPFIDARARSAFATIVSAFFFAWGEIKLTTMESIKDQFEYGDMTWALSWGAGIYSCYFIASFPMVKDLDENVGEEWTMAKTVENAFASSMIGFILLDLFCQFVVPDYWVGKDWFPQQNLRTT